MDKVIQEHQHIIKNLKEKFDKYEIEKAQIEQNENLISTSNAFLKQQDIEQKSKIKELQ